MKHLLLTTIAAVVLVGTAFAGPIHVAATNGSLEGVKHYLRIGIDVNAKELNGFTPLHLAASMGHKEVAELLIAEGANVNAKSNNGATPLDFTVYHEATEVADLLRENGGKSGAEDSIHVAATFGIVKFVKQHLAAGVDANTKNLNGSTPLHNAAANAETEIVALLINAGADVNAMDDKGETPLWTAVSIAAIIYSEKAGLKEYKDVIELLIDSGADVNAKANGKTPLDLAKPHSEIAELLLKDQELVLMPRLGSVRIPYAFTFNTIVGKTYRVDSSNDLKKWKKLREIKGTGDEERFKDTRRIYFQKHFYRVVVED